MSTVVLKFPASDLHTEVGEKSHGLIRLNSRAGVGLYGPYVDLPHGRLTARIHLTGLRYGQVTMDVSGEVGAVIFASVSIDLATTSSLPLEISADLPQPFSHCEVRLACNENVIADIASVEIELDRDAATEFPFLSQSCWVMAEVRGGLRLWLDLTDIGVSRQCLAGDYEKLETEFIENALRPGMAFMDVGANIGWYSVIAARAVGPTGVVYSFEPRPDTHKYLAKSIRENDFSHVKLFQFALSDAPGSLPIACGFSGRSPGGTWLLTTETLQTISHGYERFDVDVVRLDDLDIRRCDFMKIDIEGAEYLALRGARKTLQRLRPIIISEINPGVMQQVSGITPQEYLSFIEILGYEARRLVPGGAGELLDANFAANPPDVCNVLLVPKEEDRAGSLTQQP